MVRSDGGRRSYLLPGDSIRSKNKSYLLTYQPDGNLVIMQGAIWVVPDVVAPRKAGRASMQDDGNFVLYDADGKEYWSTQSAHGGVGPFKLILQRDRNLVLYDRNNKVLYTSGTQLEMMDG
ncbi:Mannose-specific lectin [Tetrabaena socialis]|uniref:Mannose-specific lectin n=1 Tax=Tetrabaena socialis TaxID=47790 RepID=A0A2J8ADF1_9CHLO|nr:Mannose-specific lectin [Tetrabaena socialis]|eukprot:PNH10548.1 Mannose-specific lectin [Tetrabaena socialis]